MAERQKEGMSVKIETENVEETEASAELIRELMADDARRGNWLILMHDDGRIDWRETDAKDVVAETGDGWAVLMDNVAVHEAKAAAQAFEDAHIRCRFDILSEDRSYHRYGNGGLGTRMCVLVAPEDYEKAKKVVL